MTSLGAGTAARPPSLETVAAGLFVAGHDPLSSPRCFPDEGWTVGGVSKGRSSLLSRSAPGAPAHPSVAYRPQRRLASWGLDTPAPQPGLSMGPGRPCPPESLAASAQTSAGASLLLGEVPWG